jgi:hypothetical protein
LAVGPAQDAARRYPGACPHPDGQRLVLGPDSIGVGENDDAPAGDRTRERHRPGGSGPDHTARTRAEIDTAVTRSEARRRRREPAHDPCRRADRQPVFDGSRCRCANRHSRDRGIRGNDPGKRGAIRHGSDRGEDGGHRRPDQEGAHVATLPARAEVGGNANQACG